QDAGRPDGHSGSEVHLWSSRRTTLDRKGFPSRATASLIACSNRLTLGLDLVFDPLAGRDCIDQLGLAGQPRMVQLAVRTRRVSEFLGNACQGFTVDVDAGREWLAGIGTLDY